MKVINQFFQLGELNTTPRRELTAGVTTFLTMAYILFVHPNILADAGMNKDALITVTAVASAVGCLLLGLWANVPLAMAPGMGLNAFFTYTLVVGQGLHWQTALGVVFISGLAFLILTVVGFREKIVNAIPQPLRIAIAAGIGLFITMIGFQNMGLIVDDPSTLVSLGTFGPPVLLGLFGLMVIAVLEARKIPGSILLGILAATIVGLFTGHVALPDTVISPPPSPEPLVLQLDVLAALKWGLLGSIFSFMFIDLFDSVGTMVACSYEADMVNKDGSIPKIGRMLEADAIATVVGSLLGTSTTTTYIESASGIEVGGRSGMTAVTVAVLFLLALLFTPIIGMVPSFATAPALIIVGLFMFRNIRHINLKHFEEALPAFLTIVLMPLTYSISMGLSFGFLSYILVMAVVGRADEIGWVMFVIGLFSAANLVITAFPA